MDADDLQQNETLGYKMAMSWLELAVQPYYARRAVLDFVNDIARIPFAVRVYVSSSSEQWRENAKCAHNSRYAYMCATVAGCELAIEEWEAANVDT